MAQTALVTGASRGIGRAIAIALAEAGFVVACFARDREKLQETATLIEAAGGKGSIHLGDVSSDQDIENLVNEVTSAYGSIDVLVNNAGITEGAPAKKISPQRFREVIEVNLIAPYVLSRAVQPIMKEHGGGVIINISSVYASQGVANNSPYCTSKAGLEGMTRALAREWVKDGIRVLGVAPGFVRTDMVVDAFGGTDVENLVVSRIPMKRFGEAEEIGRFVAFLATEKAGFVTGETLVIDGGQRSLV
jgi:NAD(P)-dependent dehydrogenase (short-subunit alcohol dehydrogenase family)